MNKTEGGFHKILNKIYYANLGLAILGITWANTGQKIVREEQARGLQLAPLPRFINDNCIGDLSNAFAAILGFPVIAEIINLEIQKSPAQSERVKKVSQFVTDVAPYVMTGLFVAAAIDAETGQKILKEGTPDKLDLVGAFWGASVAFPTVIKFKNKVYPKVHLPH